MFTSPRVTRGFFEIPGEVRGRIWATARRSHAAARLYRLLVWRAATQSTTPTGSVVVRLPVNPTKLIRFSVFMADRLAQGCAPRLTSRWWMEAHLSTLMEARRVQGVYEMVVDGRQVDMWWQEGEAWVSLGNLTRQVPSWPGWWSGLEAPSA